MVVRAHTRSRTQRQQPPLDETHTDSVIRRTIAPKTGQRAGDRRSPARRAGLGLNAAPAKKPIGPPQPYAHLRAKVQYRVDLLNIDGIDWYTFSKQAVLYYTL